MDAAGVIAYYVMDGNRPLTATTGSDTTSYLYGLGVIGEEINAWSYALTDGTNTQRQLTDAVGEVTYSARYTPWGDTLDTYGTGNFAFGYFGGLMDAATGLLYVGDGQYYDPSTGRFLTRGANPNSPNPYLPFDPTGALFLPLALVSLLYGKKRRKSKWDILVIVTLLSLSAGLGVAACGGTGTSQLQEGTPVTAVVTPISSSTAVVAATVNSTPVPTFTATVPPTKSVEEVLKDLCTNIPTQNLDEFFASLREPYAQFPANMKLSDSGFDFLRKWEGFYDRLYNDGNRPDEKYFHDTHGRGKGYCTIGYGHKVHNLPCNRYPQEDEFKGGITRSRAEELLRDDALIKAEVWIRSYITVRLTQTQYDALVSLYYNWGGDRILSNPEKTQLLNSGQYVATANHIRLGPVHSGGVYLESLQKRRNEEADMFLLLPCDIPNP